MLLKDEDGKPYPDDYLRDIIMNFMIAGRDTTANCLSWTFHLLSQHPEVLAKLRQEIKENGLDTPGAAPSFAQLKSMRYTEAVVKDPGNFPDCGQYLGDLFGAGSRSGSTQSYRSMSPNAKAINGFDDQDDDRYSY